MARLHLSSEVLTPATSGFWLRLLGGVDRVMHWFGRTPHLIAIHALGRKGEDLAYWTLQRHGYTIVARNYRRRAGDATPSGEIDLIGFEGTPPTLVFIEVKTRTTEGNFAAEDAVDDDKQHHIARLARAYRRRRHYQGPFRFDVVVVYMPDGVPPRIKLHRNAFSG